MAAAAAHRSKSKTKTTTYTDPDHYPDFFKVYLPELCSHRMRIPPAFVKNFEGNIPKSVIVRNSAGKFWHMDLEKIDRNFYLTKGWELFVKDNSLERGDFLIFKYSGNSVFLVKVFGTDQFKKEDLVEDRRKSPYANGNPVAKVEEDVMDEPRTSTPADNGRRRQNVAPSTNFRFVKTLNSLTYELNIPSEVGRLCDIVPASTTFHSPNGISQTVRLTRRPDRRLVAGSGWKEFCVKNNIVAGDECEFEIVFGRGRIITEVLVRVPNKSSSGCSWETMST